MTDFFQYVISGLTVGSVYALVALGFTLIYSASHVINFAQGEFVMVGGLVSVFVMSSGLPFPVAAAVALVAAVLIGFALHRFAIEPIKTASPSILIMMTIGASIAIRGLAQLLFGKQFHTMPALFGDLKVTVMGVVIQPQSLCIMITVATVVLALFWFLRSTVAGKAVRATASNITAAQLVGIDSRRTLSLSFMISAAIGAIAGILITPITLISYDAGGLLAVKGFAAAILGGIGFPPGAVFGGLLLGLIEALSAGYVSSAYKDAFAFIAMLLVLLIAPNGIFFKTKVGRV